MSVHSHPAEYQSATAAAYPPAPAAGYPPAPVADAAASTPAYPRHVVTAVLVAHDGARWLPEVLSGLLGQERPVQQAMVADTGSADDSARLLNESLGQDNVLLLARRTSFGTAVDEAVRTAPVLGPDELSYLRRPSGWDPVSRTWNDDAYDMPELPHGEPVQWLWLLHDDSAPAPDALAELLRVADANPRAAIIGPKLRGWYDARQLLEVGVSIAHSGRRWTGLERREQDQGQHDQVRPVLSVSTAGMLVRRDVWEELGGFDRRLPLMRDDVDLCWRAQSAGHEVLVAPDAVLRHAEASARERRSIDCVGRSSRPTSDQSSWRRLAPRKSSPHRVDKAGAVYTLLVNTRPRLLPYVLARLVVSTLLRTLAYLVGKVPGQALDEVAGLFGVLLRPGLILGARRRRGRPVVEPGELRPLFPPPGATLRATVEQVASNFGGRSEPELSSSGRHGAVESGPGDDDADFLEVEQFARLKRIARRPGPMLFVVLLLFSLIACRDLLGTGALSGGALLPTPGHVTDLWGRYADDWHPVGIGGTQSAPPYVGVLAALATVFLGSTAFTLTLLLVCSVPLAGFTAYFASRPLVESRLLRAWGSVVYAFLPAATGALAGGRLGTAVLGIVLPLMGRAAAAAGGLAPRSERPSWRAAWAYALLLTFTMAFTPIVWPMALVLAGGLLVLRFAESRTAYLTGYLMRLLVVLVVPLVVLAPWSLDLLGSPSRLLDEAGLDYRGGTASALDLLSLSPGGPKGGGTLLLLGVVLAALAALLRGERQLAVRTAWAVALVGFFFAAVANSSHWAGPATLVYGLALLSAAAVGAEGARERVAALSFGWRQPVALLIAVAAAAAPLVAAATWMIDGAAGPIRRGDPNQVPAFVAVESGTRDQARTLVLDGRGSDVDYALVRGSGARLGDGELAVSAGEDSRLDSMVANLVAGSGADQTDRLGGYAVRYLLVRDTAPRQIRRVLDATPGITRLSHTGGNYLYRVDRRISRITIVPGGSQGSGQSSAASAVHVAAGPVEAHTTIPSGADGRVLRVADRASPGWRATLDGRPLPKTTVDGWAQGFRLPASGGHLDLTYETSWGHTGWVWLQVLLGIVLVVMALPGRRREVDDDLPQAAGPAVTPEDLMGEGRRARRLRAAAEAERAASPDLAAPADGEPYPDAYADGYRDGAPDDRMPDDGGYDDPYDQAPDADPHGAAGMAGGVPPGAVQDGDHPGAEAADGQDPADPAWVGAAGDPQAQHDPYGQQGYQDQANPADPYAAVPQQQTAAQQQVAAQQHYADWGGQPYAGTGYQGYPPGGYQGEYPYQGDYPGEQPHQGDYQGAYQQGGYPYPGDYQGQGDYQADPYAGGQYPDPYGYGQQPYAGGYPQQGEAPYGEHEAGRDGSEQDR